jgi:hypothetical protein
VFGARDRCDYTIDRIRTVRTGDYRYIRNYYPERALMQPGYRDDRPPSMDMRRLFEAGELTEYQAEHWFGLRPREELYDIDADPHQIYNLASLPDFQAELLRHRDVLENWINDSDDQGQYSESDVQLRATYELWKERDIFKNADVNPEYSKFREASGN